MCWHKWTEWSMMYRHEYQNHMDRHIKWYKQRRCLKCGKLQEKRIYNVLA